MADGSSIHPPKADQESRADPRDHLTLRLWLRLLTCTNLVEGHIRRDLRRDFDCTLPRFDLMAQLARVPEGLKMIELSRRLMVTGGNITGLADQLEAEGLISRERVADDRRATRLRLTAAGHQRFAEMASVHERWVIDLFSSLNRDDQVQLMSLLARLKSGLLRDADPYASRAPGSARGQPRAPD